MKKSLLTLVMALVSSVMLMAQVTTSALSGIVTDDLGPVIGVTVQAIHVPSGTRYGTITNEKGAYAIRGMRVGGPYEVIISYVGAKTQKFEDITLELGETYSLNTKLLEDTDLLDEVIVVGSGSKFSSEKTGATTNIKAAQMTSMPTVSRSITEFTRLSPYGGDGMTFGGSDSRTANFTIDGANFNNNFGLSGNLPGGGTLRPFADRFRRWWRQRCNQVGYQYLQGNSLRLSSQREHARRCRRARADQFGP